MEISKSRDEEFIVEGPKEQNKGELGGLSMSASLSSFSRKRELNGDVKIGSLGNDI